MASPWEHVADEVADADRLLLRAPLGQAPPTPTPTPPPTEPFRPQPPKPPKDDSGFMGFLKGLPGKFLEKLGETGFVTAEGAGVGGTETKRRVEAEMASYADLFNKAMLPLEPIQHMVGPYVLEGLKASAMSREYGVGGDAPGLGFGPVSPADMPSYAEINPPDMWGGHDLVARSLVKEFLTGTGDLSGPELAGVLRERFQERPIGEQMALGVLGDPLMLPLIKGAKLGVAGTRLALRSGALTGAPGGARMSGGLGSLGPTVADIPVSRTAARTYVKRSDVVSKDAIGGGKQWVAEGPDVPPSLQGEYLAGPDISWNVAAKADLPDVLYHVTSKGEYIGQWIRAITPEMEANPRWLLSHAALSQVPSGLQGAGLGGRARSSVSLTTNKDVAESISRELIRLGDVVRTPPGGMKAFILRAAQEDEIAAGIRKGAITDSKEFKAVLNQLDIHAARASGDLSVDSKHLYDRYLAGRESIAYRLAREEVGGAVMGDTVAKKYPILMNPVLTSVDPEAAALIRPENVRIIEVPTSQIPDDVFIRGQSTLDEVEVFADIPLTKEGKRGEIIPAREPLTPEEIMDDILDEGVEYPTAIPTQVRHAGTLPTAEEGGFRAALERQPQGIYTSQADVGEGGHLYGDPRHGDQITFDVNPEANVLDVSGTNQETAGMGALYKLLGNRWADNFLDKADDDALAFLMKKYPDKDWSYYRNTDEMFDRTGRRSSVETWQLAEVYGGILARQQRYDAIWMGGRTAENNEFVVLTPRAVKGDPAPIPSEAAVPPPGAAPGDPVLPRAAGAPGAAIARRPANLVEAERILEEAEWEAARMPWAAWDFPKENMAAARAASSKKIEDARIAVREAGGTITPVEVDIPLEGTEFSIYRRGKADTMGQGIGDAIEEIAEEMGLSEADTYKRAFAYRLTHGARDTEVDIVFVIGDDGTAMANMGPLKMMDDPRAFTLEPGFGRDFGPTGEMPLITSDLEGVKALRNKLKELHPSIKRFVHIYEPDAGAGPIGRAGGFAHDPRSGPEIGLQQSMLGDPPSPPARTRVPPMEGLAETPATTMPPDEADEIVDWFGKLISSPGMAVHSTLRKSWLTREKGQRAQHMKARVQDLVDGGMGIEKAMSQARKESFSGPYDVWLTGLEKLITDDITDALFNKVYRVLKDDVFEMMATQTALTNALKGIPIPRTPVTKVGKTMRGGTAYDRLARVFPKDVLEGLETDFTTLIRRAEGPSYPREPITQFPEELWNPRAKPLLGLEPGGQPPTTIWPDRPRKSAAEVDIERQQMGTEFADPVPESDIVLGPLGETQALRKGLESEQLAQGAGEPWRPKVDDPYLNDRRTRAEIELDTQAFATSIAPAPEGRQLGLTEGMGALDDVTYHQMRLLPKQGKNLVEKAAQEGWLTAIDIGNLIRSNMTTVDLSWLRQQAFLIFGNPGKFAEGMNHSVRSIFSASYAQKIDDAIKSDDLYPLYNKVGGDFIRPLDGKAAAQWEAAEDFMILSLAEGQKKARPLQRFANRLPWIRISARAHITGTNVMNFGIWKKHVQTLMDINEQMAKGMLEPQDMGWIEKQGRTIFGSNKQFAKVIAQDEAFSIEKSAGSLAKMLADMSGRGPLGSMQRLSPALNAGFFSARLMMGRLISPRHLVSADPMTRRMAWRNLATAVAGFGSIIFAGNKMGLWEVDYDARSADFMKIRIGQIRIDPWGGFQQYAVLYWRLVASALTASHANELIGMEEGGFKSTKHGLTGKIDPLEQIAGFTRGKASPGLGMVLRWWTEKDFKGSDIDRRDIMGWLEQGGIPLAAQDIYESLKAEGITGLVGTSGVLGAGVLVYELPRWKELDYYYRIEGKTPAETTKLRKLWRQTHRIEEAQLFVRGDIETLSTGTARDEAKRLIEKHDLNTKVIPGYVRTFGTVKEKLEEGLDPGYNPPPRPGDRPNILPPPSTPTTPIWRRSAERRAGEPSSASVPVDKWQEVRKELDSPLLAALNRVWFDKGRLTRSEERRLREIHSTHTLGQPNFNAWLKQTLRQVHEGAIMAA